MGLVSLWYDAVHKEDTAEQGGTTLLVKVVPYHPHVLSHQQDLSIDLVFLYSAQLMPLEKVQFAVIAIAYRVV